ncbi:MAG: hypothetical protein WC587_03540 [Candidatus Paceibacterota bacterium]
MALYFTASYYKEWKDKNDTAQQQKPDEIIITELPNGEKLVENKTEGVSVKIPSGWDTQKPLSYQEPIMAFSQHCKFESGILDEKLTIEELKKRLEKPADPIATIKLQKIESMNINNKPAVKRILDIAETGYIEEIYLILSKIYWFTISPLEINQEENCSKYLNTIVNSFSYEK